jgi:hypothetical protein
VKRSLTLPLVALLALAPAAHGAHLFSCINCGIHCMVPPCETPDCTEACPHGPCLPWHSKCACKLMEDLCSAPCCCDRIKAAEKLGCCLYANWGCNPEILDALVNAMECDTCWQVRQTAAWSLALQRARTQYVVLAVYMASRLDHHYQVRDTATQALSILVPCQTCCYKQLFASVDKQAGALRPYYNPTNHQCLHLELNCGCITVHVCKLEEVKKPVKPECLIPIKIAVDGVCPVCHDGGCPSCGGPPALPPEVGLPLAGPPAFGPGPAAPPVPERLPGMPAPVPQPIR